MKNLPFKNEKKLVFKNIKTKDIKFFSLFLKLCRTHKIRIGRSARIGGSASSPIHTPVINTMNNLVLSYATIEVYMLELQNQK